MDRATWLAERRKGIGGSDAAAAVGQSMYCTPYELWAEKTGLIAGELPETERMTFGRIMENVIASRYAETHGVRVRRRNTILRHEQYPWMLANLDRVVEGQRVGLECKNVDVFAYRAGEWGEPGSDEIPVEYFLQVTHYLAVTGFDLFHLAVCIGGNRQQTYTIERDEELIEQLIDQEAGFWQCVETNTPPDFDYAHPTALRLARQLYPGTSGAVIDLPDEAMHWHRVRIEADLEAKAYEATKDGATAHLLHLMGGAAVGRLSDGTEYRRKTVERKGYAVEPCQYIDFRHAKPRESKQ